MIPDEAWEACIVPTTAPPLPATWDQEPWPLDEPDRPTFRPVNHSDSHDSVPQVADLADEAWEYAVDHGVSLERALVEVQGRRMRGGGGFHTGGVVSTRTVNFLADVEPYRQAMERVMTATMNIVNRVDIDKLAKAIEQFADDAEEAKRKPRICPTHGPMTAGGFCRRCGR